MKKERELDLRNAFMPVTERFHDRVDRTLAQIIEQEERPPMKKAIWRTALIAAILTAFCLGTALAVGNMLGILDFFGKGQDIEAREDAERSIQKNLGSYETELLRLTVREAVYDGRSVRAVIEVCPIDAAKHVVACPWLDGSQDDEPAEALAERTGRAIAILPALHANSNTDSIPADYGEPSFAMRRQGDSVFLYAEAGVESRDGAVAPEQISMVFTDDITDDTQEPLRIRIDIARCEVENTEYMTDAGNFDDIRVVSVTLTQTPFAEYIEVSYAANTLSRQSDPSVSPNADTTYYGTAAGRFIHTDPECSGMRRANILTPEEIYANGYEGICPVCAGGESAGPVSEWRFERVGAEQETCWYRYTREDAETGEELFVAVSLYQNGKAALTAFDLLAIGPDGQTGGTIRCMLGE